MTITPTVQEMSVTMYNKAMLSNPLYRPNVLLDALIERFKLKNDAALCRALKVQPPIISKVRHRVLPVSDGLLLRMHDATELSIAELRELMGVPAPVSPIASPQPKD